MGTLNLQGTSYRFTLYSGLLYPVDVYPNYPTNHSWRRYKVETLLDI